MFFIKTLPFLNALTLLFAKDFIIDNSRIEPLIHEASLGQTVTFSCNSGGRVTWTHNGGDLPQGRSSHGPRNSLQIVKVILRDAGTYECSGGTLDPNKRFIASGELRVYDGTKITPTKEKVFEGGDGYFKCYSVTMPQWLFNDQSLPSNAVLDNVYLRIHEATLENTGCYECIGTTEHGHQFRARGELKVLLRDNYKLSPSSQKVFIGQSVNFHCLSDMPVEWSFMNGPLPRNVKVQQKKATNLYLLSIKSVLKSNAGSYQCEGTDREGGYSFYAESELLILGECPKPDLSLSIVNISSTAVGAITKFHCEGGFELHGSSMRECLSNGDWSGDRPYCRQIVSKMQHFKYTSILTCLFLLTPCTITS